MIRMNAIFLFGLILLQHPFNQSIDVMSISGKVVNKPSYSIQPYAKNKFYWQYKGKPVVLLGGSKEDNLFQIAGLAGHLDTLSMVGGNYVRNTMSSRDPGNEWPFFQRADRKYDLNRLNDTYFERFEDLLRLAVERDIIVQVELWDRFDFAREPWLNNPYNPANNVNYTSTESKLQSQYPDHPVGNENPFFRSIPAYDNNQVLLKYQHAQIDRLLEISSRYPNVLYTMDNETSGIAEWGAYWSNYIQQRAAEVGLKIFTTEMWDEWDLRDKQHLQTLEHPELYAFVDISQNNHNEGQTHWDNLQWVREYTASEPRPLNNVKIYGASTGRFGTDKDALERFWRGIIGGAASVRFHRPPSGIGLNSKAQTHIKSASILLETVDIISFTPDAENKLLSERAENEAYLTYRTNEQYVIFFPDGGEVMLDLEKAKGSFKVQWLNIEKCSWLDEQEINGGKKVSLESPGRGNWIVLLTK